MQDGLFAATPLMESLGQAVVATDLEGCVRYWNAGAERMYGWTAEEAIGRSAAELNQPSVSKALCDEIFRTVRAGGQWSGGLSHRRKDGSLVSALVTDAGIFDPDGRLVGVVALSVGVGSALRPMLAHMSEAALILDAAGRVNHVSPAAARNFGWTEGSVGGEPLWELIHPDDRQDAVELYRDVVVSAGTGSALECRVRQSDGSMSWVDLLLVNLLNDPAVRGVMCNLRDINERIGEAQQRSELIEQLQTALHSRVEIEQAKGMISARTGVAVDKAFLMLRRFARDNNLKLHDLAHGIVTGEVQLPLSGQVRA
jgi:PAS domain S-box-containing protein